MKTPDLSRPGMERRADELLSQARLIIADINTLHATKHELPRLLSERLTAETPTSPQYMANGLTQPREDGCVRSRAWDNAIDQALHSADEPTRRWAEQNTGRRWMYIQDTLAIANPRQRDAILMNCAKARMVHGLLGKGSKYNAWLAYLLAADEHGPTLDSNTMPDAFSLPSDVTIQGVVEWQGTRASDMAEFARRSLAYFKLTSGQAMQPLTPWSFGGPAAPASQREPLSLPVGTFEDRFAQRT